MVTISEATHLERPFDEAVRSRTRRYSIMEGIFCSTSVASQQVSPHVRDTWLASDGADARVFAAVDLLRASPARPRAGDRRWESRDRRDLDPNP